MVGIKDIATYIPETRISTYERAHLFGIDDAFLENKIGVQSLPQKAADEETSDMCVRAFEALTEKSNLSAGDIECIVVCTQNPDGSGLPHTSAIVHGKLGCSDNVAAFDVSLGCSGYVYCLALTTSFMNANGMKKGLLFTADPYSKIVAPHDKNTSLLFGDAATVTFLGDDPILEAKQFIFGTRGKESQVLRIAEGRLHMNGRSVFNLTMTVVPPQIRALLEAGGYKLSDIDLFLLHQGSKYLLDILCQRLNLDAGKVPVNLRGQGNTVSSSIPLLLADYLVKAEFRTVLISGFGVGFSWASGILTRM